MATEPASAGGTEMLTAEERIARGQAPIKQQFLVDLKDGNKRAPEKLEVENMVDRKLAKMDGKHVTHSDQRKANRSAMQDMETDLAREGVTAKSGFEAELNHLGTETMTLLRKNQYPFSLAKLACKKYNVAMQGEGNKSNKKFAGRAPAQPQNQSKADLKLQKAKQW